MTIGLIIIILKFQKMNAKFYIFKHNNFDRENKKSPIHPLFPLHDWCISSINIIKSVYLVTILSLIAIIDIFCI